VELKIKWKSTSIEILQVTWGLKTANSDNSNFLLLLLIHTFVKNKTVLFYDYKIEEQSVLSQSVLIN